MRSCTRGTMVVLVALTIFLLGCSSEGKQQNLSDSPDGAADADASGTRDAGDGDGDGDHKDNLDGGEHDGGKPDSGPVTCSGAGACDDHDPCTIDDTCSAAVCVGRPKCEDLCFAGTCGEINSKPPIVAANGSTCVLSDEGALACWGGAVTYPANGPVAKIVNLGSPVAQIAAWSGHKCLLLKSGDVRCWGTSGGQGKLGYPGVEKIDDPAAAPNVDLGGPAVSIAVGSNHSCAALADGTVRCWGQGGSRLGYGDGDLADVGREETPAARGVVNVGGKAVEVSVGDRFSCALLASRELRCWGPSGFSGAADSFIYGDDESPAQAPVAVLGGKVRQFSAGYQHVCAVLEDKTLRCWGAGTSGRLGYGDTEFVGGTQTPAAKGAVNVGGPVIQVSCGYNHTCAVLEDRSVRCWGLGDKGRLGYGNTHTIGDNETPGSLARGVDVGGPVAYVSAGGFHTCALLMNGAVRCWGDGERYVHGHNTMEDIGDDETPASAGDVPVW